jgi:hypothetical protein
MVDFIGPPGATVIANAGDFSVVEVAAGATPMWTPATPAARHGRELVVAAKSGCSAMAASGKFTPWWRPATRGIGQESARPLRR